MRSSSFSLALLVAPAWFVAKDPPSTTRFIVFIVAIAFFGGFVQILNDIMDRENDTISASYLPLPSGLVTVPQAIATATAVGGVVVVGIAVGSSSLGRLAFGLGGLVLVSVMLAAYTRLKRRLIIGPVTHASMTTLISVTSWAFAGAGRTGLAALVFAFTFLFGFASNANATLRDIDQSGSLEDTIAVRLGVRGTLFLVAALDLVCNGIVVVLGNALGAPMWTVATFVAVAVGWRVWALARVVPSTRQDDGRERADRLRDLKPTSLSRFATQLAIYSVLSAPAALVGFAVVWLFSLLDRVYTRRIVRGELARRIDFSTSGGPAGPSPLHR